MPRLFHMESVNHQLPAQGVSDLSALYLQKALGRLQGAV